MAQNTDDFEVPDEELDAIAAEEISLDDTCPNCKGRIPEETIPDEEGNIECITCGHIFTLGEFYE